MAQRCWVVCGYGSAQMLEADDLHGWRLAKLDELAYSQATCTAETESEQENRMRLALAPSYGHVFGAKCRSIFCLYIVILKHYEWQGRQRLQW